MNYRHAYHAGNFADVMKHAVLARIVEHLKAKEKPFRVIDTHAGVGLYDLSAGEALKTGEWRDGIGRLLDARGRPKPLPAPLAALLSPYFEAVAAANGGGRLAAYPGSPSIVRHLLRRTDRLTAVELHPQDHAALAALFAGDIQTKAIALDGWLALGSFVPPKERRGLVLVDPPFEERDEFDRLADGFLGAYRKWPTGLYALWYPIKNIAAVAAFRRRLRDSGVQKLLAAELWVRDRTTPDRFNGSGLVLCNPPYQLEAELRVLLPGLLPLLAEGPGAGWAADWLRGEA